MTIGGIMAASISAQPDASFSGGLNSIAKPKLLESGSAHSVPTEHTAGSAKSLASSASVTHAITLIDPSK